MDALDSRMVNVRISSTYLGFTVRIPAKKVDIFFIAIESADAHYISREMFLDPFIYV